MRAFKTSIVFTFVISLIYTFMFGFVLHAEDPSDTTICLKKKTKSEQESCLNILRSYKKDLIEAAKGKDDIDDPCKEARDDLKDAKKDLKDVCSKFGGNICSLKTSNILAEGEENDLLQDCREATTFASEEDFLDEDEYKKSSVYSKCPDLAFQDAKSIGKNLEKAKKEMDKAEEARADLAEKSRKGQQQQTDQVIDVQNKIKFINSKITTLDSQIENTRKALRDKIFIKRAQLTDEYYKIQQDFSKATIRNQDTIDTLNLRRLDALKTCSDVAEKRYDEYRAIQRQVRRGKVRRRNQKSVNQSLSNRSYVRRSYSKKDKYFRNCKRKPAYTSQIEAINKSVRSAVESRKQLNLNFQQRKQSLNTKLSGDDLQADTADKVLVSNFISKKRELLDQLAQLQSKVGSNMLTQGQVSNVNQTAQFKAERNAQKAQANLKQFEEIANEVRAQNPSLLTSEIKMSAVLSAYDNLKEVKDKQPLECGDSPYGSGRSTASDSAK